MSHYVVKVVDQHNYRKLSPRAKRLFDADMPKLAHNPRNPAGLRVSVAGRDTWQATVADGEVIIQYRINDVTVEVRINAVIAL